MKFGNIPYALEKKVHSLLSERKFHIDKYMFIKYNLFIALFCLLQPYLLLAICSLLY